MDETERAAVLRALRRQAASVFGPGGVTLVFSPRNKVPALGHRSIVEVVDAGETQRVVDWLDALAAGVTS
jgi:hypothetical protein